MIYKNFRFSIFIRVAIVVILAVALAFILAERPSFFLPLVIAIFLLAAVVNLIRYIEKTNKDLTHFLLSLRQGAFTESYTSGQRGTQYEKLSDAMNDVVREFAKVNEQKELHYQFLEALNENISVAILSFDSDGKLLMMNRAAKQLLNQPSFSKLEHFRRIDPVLFEIIQTSQPESRSVVRTVIGEQQYQLSVQSKEIILQSEHVKIILLQNLNSELEEKEIDAWHQLMRVLTHEIMNSVTPIVSLTKAVETILYNPDGTRKNPTSLTDENADDVYSSLTTIGSRSKGLVNFVKAYKEYSKPIDLHLENVDVTALAQRTIQLLTPDLQKSNISVGLTAPTSTEAKADQALIEQVLINLIKNAIEAVSHDGSGKIIVEVVKKPIGTVNVSVIDNGTGIDQENISKIFVPFFTTKPKGSGIGLSLSRQIMKLHNGTIRVQSTIGKGSAFILEWK
jgi:two-component system, NtrC family, nitrogen regulation sensor histidine kinase NtrY